MNHTQQKCPDGSIWSDTFQLRSYPSLTQNISTEVLIIGGGLAGILCAHRLQEKGVPVVVVEANQVAGGITKNTTAKITSQHGMIFNKMLKRFGTELTKQYLEANEEAVAEYRRIARDIACDFENQENFIYTRLHPEKLEKEFLALQRIRYPARFQKNLPLPFQTAGAVVFPYQAQFHPLKFISGIIQGLEIYEQTQITEFIPKRTRMGKGITYQVKWKSRQRIPTVTKNDVKERKKESNLLGTDNEEESREGIIYTRNIIVTTHFPINNKHGAYYIKMYQNRSYVLGIDGVSKFSGMYLDEEEGGNSFRFFGNTLLFGGDSHRTGKKTRRQNNQQEYSCLDLHTRVKQWYPNGNVNYYWAAQDCMTLDQIPYIGQYAKSTPGFYVATGFNKWGMTSSMVAARLLCDKILNKKNPYEEVFDPSRTILRKQLFINLGETTVNMLTPTKKRCPHLGCALKWNEEEHSWDCPCHGSRFTEEGKLLDNPATMK